MRRVIGIAVAAITCASLAACGSSEDKSSGSGGTRTQATAPNAATQAVAALRRPPGALAIPALGKRPPAQKTAYWISCKFPECLAGDPGFTAAMHALGWKLTTIRPELTPEGQAAAWSQAVAAKPTAIFAVYPLPSQIIKSQLAQAQANGTSVILAGSDLAVGQDGVDASIASTPSVQANGRALVDWAVADAGGKAKMAVLYDPSYPLHVAALNAGRKEAAKVCPSCSYEGLSVQYTQAGKEVPGEVVSYLQKHPDVKYVLSSGTSSLALGVGQAVKAAGLPVKVGTAQSTAEDLDGVAKGTEAVAVPNELGSVAWRMADAAVRLAARDPLPASLAAPEGARQLFDTTNIAGVDTSKPWDVPDVAQTFTKAWDLG